jgi:recombination protein RecA
VKEEDRRRTIQRKVAAMRDPGVSAISSGAPALDRLLGGGWARGEIVELFGGPSAGKTSLMLRSAARAQSSGLTPAWIDADHTFDPAYAASLGVDVRGMPVLQPASAEEAMEIALRLALSRAVDLIIVDSAAALVPAMEMEAQIGDSSPGLHARVLASGLRKLAAAARRTGTSILFSNHERDPGDATVSSASAGGPPLKLHAAVRLSVEPARGGVRLRARKNRVASTAGECFVGFDPGNRAPES